jgi:hypothetical protein
MIPFMKSFSKSVSLYRILVGNPEEKRQQGRPRCSWDDNIVTYLINELPSNGSVYNINNRESFLWGQSRDCCYAMTR